MMRSVEIVLVIFILTGAFIIASSFAVLPEPRQASPVNLRRLALTTLQMLDSNHELSEVAFSNNSTLWGGLQVALSASLPPDVVYNLTVYNVTGGGGSGAALYTPLKSVSNAESLGVSSDASSYFVASSNVTFTYTPEKIGEHGGGGTLYILNCSDANGWWITGYTAQSLAEDLYKLLSPYFVKTVMVQNTAQLGQILNGTALQGETVQNAVVINTFGEAVPIPPEYCTTYSSNYARYCHLLGNMTRLYNWTWASIVGYPFYYVSNTISLKDRQNGWGIYGMNQTGQAGMNAFLQGLDNRNFTSDPTDIKSEVGVVSLSTQVSDSCNYYGIYPYPNQTSTRALRNSTLSSYNLYPTLQIFNSVNVGGTIYNPGALYNHRSGTRIEGSLLALGLTRTPDIRITAISLLSYYRPALYPSEYTASEKSRLVVLQLGLVGGV